MYLCKFEIMVFFLKQKNVRHLSSKHFQRISQVKFCSLLRRLGGASIKFISTIIKPSRLFVLKPLEKSLDRLLYLQIFIIFFHFFFTPPSKIVPLCKTSILFTVNFYCTFKVLKNKENRKTLLIPTHPATHSENKGFRDFQKGGYSRIFLRPQFWFANHI